MKKRVVSMILTLLLVTGLSLSVCALEVPDYDRRGSIAVSMNYQGNPVSGGTLILYRVADVVNSAADFAFAYTSDFAESAILVENLNNANLPEELCGIVNSKALSGIARTVNEEGKTTFSDLEIGLYLIVQENAAPGFERINPFLVSVPYRHNGGYVYDVDTAPKNLPGPETAPTDPPTTTEPSEPAEPDEPKLPQTGQTNWPIPVMAVLGILLIIGGYCLRVSEKRKYYEA